MIAPTITGSLLIMTIIAMWTDFRYRKIPNWLTFTGILSGFVYHGLATGLSGLQLAGVGFALGVAILFFPFAKGGIGAGDVKMLAALGTWMGAEMLLPACLWMGVIGACLSLYAIWKQRIWKLAFYGLTVKGVATECRIPYGIAIGLGIWLELGRLFWLTAGGSWG